MKYSCQKYSEGLYEIIYNTSWLFLKMLLAKKMFDEVFWKKNEE